MGTLRNNSSVLFQFFSVFLNTFTHFYKRVWPSVGRSVQRLLWGGKRENNNWLTNLMTLPYQQTPPPQPLPQPTVPLPSGYWRWNTSLQLPALIKSHTCTNAHTITTITLSYLDASRVACRPCLNYRIFNQNRLIATRPHQIWTVQLQLFGLYGWVGMTK